MGFWTDEHHYLANYLKTKGSSIEDIARELKVDHQTVRYNINKGPPSIRRRTRKVPNSDLLEIRRRRKNVLMLWKEVKIFQRVHVSPVRKNLRFRTLTRFPFRTAPRIKRELGRRFHIRVCVNTVRSDLLALGKIAKRRGKGPHLSILDKEKRVAFSRWALTQEDNIIFSDEKTLVANDCSGAWEWCDPGEVPSVREMDQGAARVTLWGAIGRGGRKKLIIVLSTVSKEIYRKDILSRAVPLLKKWSDEGFYFLQDNAPPHRGSLDFLSSQGINVIRNYPPRSCDMNPIEQLWKIIAERVSDCAPWTEKDLVEFVTNTWREISGETVEKLCSSWYSRHEKIIAREGNLIKP